MHRRGPAVFSAVHLNSYSTKYNCLLEGTRTRVLPDVCFVSFRAAQSQIVARRPTRRGIRSEAMSAAARRELLVPGRVPGLNCRCAGTEGALNSKTETAWTTIREAILVGLWQEMRTRWECGFVSLGGKLKMRWASIDCPLAARPNVCMDRTCRLGRSGARVRHLFAIGERFRQSRHPRSPNAHSRRCRWITASRSRVVQFTVGGPLRLVFSESTAAPLRPGAPTGRAPRTPRRTPRIPRRCRPAARHASGQSRASSARSGDPPAR